MAAQPLILSSMSLSNFRGFKSEAEIPLAPLTFLVGPNSSGKSSLFAAIALLAQSDIDLRDPLTSDVSWDGRLVDAGSFFDAVFGHKTNLTIKIAVELSTSPVSFRPWGARTPVTGRSTPVRLTVGLRKGGKKQLGVVSSISLADVTSGRDLTMDLIPRRPRSPSKLIVKVGQQTFQMSGAIERSDRASGRQFTKRLKETIRAQSKRDRGAAAGWRRIYQLCTSWAFQGFLMTIQRVSSGRSSPKRWYPLSGGQRSVYEQFPSRFDSVDPTLIGQALGAESRKKSKVARLERFLGTLDIGSKLDASPLSPYHSAIRIKDNRTGVISNLIDVGYGASQIIPVVAACESGFHGPLFVEQPEIHLHPRAQGEVADLLIDTSRRRQVFVETHSVHLINRARLAIVKGSLSARDVLVLYVNRDRSGSHVRDIPILEDGEFATKWPEGFFEERYRDTLELLAAKSKHSK